MKKIATLIASMLVSTSVSAHTLYILPSHFTVSKENSWITVDVTAANRTFEADKGINLGGFSYQQNAPAQASRGQGGPQQGPGAGAPAGPPRGAGATTLVLHTPSGEAQQIKDSYQGRRKAIADILLPTDGTYRIEIARAAMYLTTYEVAGERKRLAANKEELKGQLPVGAEKVETVRSRSRTYTYVTVNAPSTEVVELKGEGLEISSKEHPADFVAEEPLTLVFNLDGKPQAGVKATLSREGEVYRNEAGRQEFTSDKNGAITFTAEEAGQYMIEASFAADVKSNLADKVRESVVFIFEIGLP